MSQVHFYQNESGKIRWIAATLVMVTIIVFSLLLWPKKEQPIAPPADKEKAIATEEMVEEPFPEDPDIEKRTPEETKKEVEVVMEKQKKAALAAIDAKPIEGIVTERPDFVSEIEWEVFQSVILQQSENPESENQEPGSEINLTYLVSKLLFYKKLDAWESMLADSSSDTEKRHTLARELLAMIPAQLNEKSFDLKTAKKMEGELQSDLNNEKK